MDTPALAPALQSGGAMLNGTSCGLVAACALLAACLGTVGSPSDPAEEADDDDATIDFGDDTSDPPEEGAGSDPETDPEPGSEPGSEPDPCEPIEGVSYDLLDVEGPPTDRPAAEHGDLNLRLRSWEPVPGAFKGLLSIDGLEHDDLAPRLYTLFTDDRVPEFPEVYAVQAWDWGCNCPVGLIDWPEVTLVGMATSPGEVIQQPTSGYDIGGGHAAMVLYVGEDTITLKLTREDDVVRGYTIHIAGICVEPSLRQAYEAAQGAGRGALPALYGRQPLGRARGAEIFVASRDTGSWGDPRTRDEWR